MFGGGLGQRVGAAEMTCSNSKSHEATPKNYSSDSSPISHLESVADMKKNNVSPRTDRLQV